METPSSPPPQANYATYVNAQEENNLRALSIGCVVYGCFQAIMLLFQAAMMRTMMQLMTNPQSFFPTVQGAKQPPPPQFPIAFMHLFQTMMIGTYVFLGIGALLAFWAAKCIHDRKHWIVPMIAGGFACLYVPIGPVLGVFIFVLLTKPSMRARFSS